MAASEPSSSKVSKEANGAQPEPGKKHANWRFLFGSNSKDNVKLSYRELKIVDGKKVVSAPPQVIEPQIEYWSSCIIGQFFGKAPPFFMVKYLVDKHWSKFGKCDIKTVDDSSFIFKFDTEEASKKLLNDMRHVNDRLLLRKWTPDAKYLELDAESFPLLAFHCRWIVSLSLGLSLVMQDSVLR